MQTTTQPTPQPTRYGVYDQRTGALAAGPYQTAQRARNMRDRLDLGYGAVRYVVRAVA